MSRLAVGKDDHPEAARKHLGDSHALALVRRHDGAAYHAGYVVECSLKSVLLHDKSYDAATGQTNAARLTTWGTTLRRSYGHDLSKLLAATVGPEGARYMPLLPTTASITLNWSETMRYWAAGAVSAAEADAFLSWADLAFEAVVQMTLDGVV